MISTKIKLVDNCGVCKENFRNEEQVVLTRHNKFFHSNCFKMKNFIYKFFNPIRSKIIWKENRENEFSLDLNDSLKEQPSGDSNEATGEGAYDIQQLTIKSSPTAGSDSDSENNSDSTEDDLSTIPDSKYSSLDMGLTRNLIEIRNEIISMREKLNIFAAAKENDEKIIEALKRTLEMYKYENMELRWENRCLEAKLFSSSLNHTML